MPKGAQGIMDDEDEGPVDFMAFGKKDKKKKKTDAELKAEREKAEAEAAAALPSKGKPSTFFIMDHIPGDMRDTTG